jgi:hypothetical protein
MTIEKLTLLPPPKLGGARGGNKSINTNIKHTVPHLTSPNLGEGKLFPKTKNQKPNIF